MIDRKWPYNETLSALRLRACLISVRPEWRFMRVGLHKRWAFRQNANEDRGQLRGLARKFHHKGRQAFLMSEFFQRILDLVARQEVLISDHGYDELATDDILVKDVLEGASEGTVVKKYATYHKGPCVLVLQKASEGKPIHVVWGIPSQADSPAVVVTAYRPDPSRWTDDFLRRKS